MELNVKLGLDALQDAENIADLITDEEQLKTIGSQVLQAYQADKASRQRWEDKMEAAEKLALQVKEPKSYPWPDASNVKFPLITIAAMQFAARAYPALVKAPDLVKFRKQGKDGGEKAARASRVSAHMSYQLLEEDEPWEEHHDKALFAVGILGCVFKKSYYDKVKGHNCSTLVLPKNLVVHYFARSIEECERKTEVFELSPREIKERQLRGIFRDIDLPQPSIPEPKVSDKREGLSPPPADKDSPITFLEQHCFLDLDGDGYKEPYIVTVCEINGDVVRIKSRFGKITTEQSVKIDDLQKRIKALAEGVEQPENPTAEDIAKIQRIELKIRGMQAQVELLSQQTPRVLHIEPVEYYTKYPFIPSPDGGFYDLGFGALLGPLNDSVDTLINQIIDAGAMNSGAIGFIGKGGRMKGGKLRFQPNEFKKLNASGANIRDAVVPLNLNPPSPVLYQLLSLLISYSERVGSVTDAMVGENPGQNTPAYNMSAMLEQGLQVFNGIFKRIYRSMRSEFRKLYILNSAYLDDESYFTYHDSDSKVLRTDYTADPKDLIPAADPNAFSNKEKLEKASIILQRADSVPGYNPIVKEKRWLSALDIPDVDEVYPTRLNEQGIEELVFPPQPSPEFELEREDLARKTLEGKTRHDLQRVEVEGKLMVNEAQVIKLMADASVAADKPALERLKMQLEEMQSKREALTDITVANIQAESAEKTANARKQSESNKGTTK